MNDIEVTFDWTNKCHMREAYDQLSWFYEKILPLLSLFLTLYLFLSRDLFIYL